MIRPATMHDIPEILGLLEELHGLAPRPVAFDRKYCAGNVAVAINGDDWLVLVADIDGVVGLIIASAGPTLISPEMVGIERAWFCRIHGQGAKLRERYEAWCRAWGCKVAHIGLFPGDQRKAVMLGQAGYVETEAAYVKVL